MIHVTGPSPWPSPSSFTYFTVQGLLLEQPMKGGWTIQTKMSMISLQTAGLLFAPLCCLIFILALEQELELLARKTNL